MINANDDFMPLHCNLSVSLVRCVPKISALPHKPEMMVQIAFENIPGLFVYDLQWHPEWKHYVYLCVVQVL